MTLSIAYQASNTAWHFPVMILASFLLLLFIIRWVIGKTEFDKKRKAVYTLSVLVVVIGMLLGTYGAQLRMPWWVYYPVPLLLTVLLPPIILKMNFRRTLLYLFLSLLSAPFLNAFFSFFLGWTENIPFWEIPYIGDL